MYLNTLGPRVKARVPNQIFYKMPKICISDENRTDDFNFVKTKNIML